jgi:hypothetical protein
MVGGAITKLSRALNKAKLETQINIKMKMKNVHVIIMYYANATWQNTHGKLRKRGDTPPPPNHKPWAICAVCAMRTQTTAIIDHYHSRNLNLNLNLNLWPLPLLCLQFAV